MSISYDCLINENVKVFGDSLFLFKVFISCFFPFILLFLFWGLGLVIKLALWKWLNYKRLMVITLITLFFNLYSGISSNVINLFNCTKIETSFLLTHDMTMSCWKSKHLIWSLSFGIPFIAIWILGLPLFCIVFLFFNKKKVGSESFNTYFILLY